MKTGDLIKKYRQARGMTQSELAEKVGFEDRSTISKIERNQRNVNQEQILRIANVLDVAPADLISTEGNEPLQNARPLPPVFTCGYFHSVSAGIGAYADNQSEKYSYCFNSQSQADRCFAVDVQGDSMEPELHDGDVVIVDTEEPYVNDDIVVFYDKSDELGFIKKYRKTNNYVMFISINTAYDAMIFPLSDFADRIKIHGKVIASNRKY